MDFQTPSDIIFRSTDNRYISLDSILNRVEILNNNGISRFKTLFLAGVLAIGGNLLVDNYKTPVNEIIYVSSLFGGIALIDKKFNSENKERDKLNTFLSQSREVDPFIHSYIARFQIMKSFERRDILSVNDLLLEHNLGLNEALLYHNICRDFVEYGVLCESEHPATLLRPRKEHEFVYSVAH